MDFVKMMSDFEMNPPADITQITIMQEKIGFKLPLEYVEFLMKANGGEGSIGESYVRLWKVEEIPQMNAGYGVQDNLVDLWAFGTNGGGEAFCFDLRIKDIPIVVIPFVSLVWEDAIYISHSFHEFLEKLYHDTIFD